jgi:hypothetical protein
MLLQLLSVGAEDIGWERLSISLPQLAISFNRHRAGVPSPIAVPLLRSTFYAADGRIRSALRWRGLRRLTAASLIAGDAGTDASVTTTSGP